MTRRAPVQGAAPREWRLLPEAFAVRWRAQLGPSVPYGTIPWNDHLRVYEAYALRFGRDQTPERMAERGGFGVTEIAYLGCVEVLERWEPR